MQIIIITVYNPIYKYIFQKDSYHRYHLLYCYLLNIKLKKKQLFNSCTYYVFQKGLN